MTPSVPLLHGSPVARRLSGRIPNSAAALELEKGKVALHYWRGNLCGAVFNAWKLIAKIQRREKSLGHVGMIVHTIRKSRTRIRTATAMHPRKCCAHHVWPRCIGLTEWLCLHRDRASRAPSPLESGVGTALPAGVA
jgi:hypothetical protein